MRGLRLALAWWLAAPCAWAGPGSSARIGGSARAGTPAAVGFAGALPASFPVEPAPLLSLEAPRTEASLSPLPGRVDEDAAPAAPAPLAPAALAQAPALEPGREPAAAATTPGAGSPAAEDAVRQEGDSDVVSPVVRRARRSIKGLLHDPFSAVSMRPSATAAFESLDDGYAADPARVDALVRALGEGDWSHAVFESPEESVHLALAAHRAGRIGLGQLSSVILRWEAFDDVAPPASQRVAVPLMEGGRLTPFARELVKGRGKEGLNLRQTMRLERLLQRLPASERFVWVLRPDADRIGSRFWGAQPEWGKTYWDIQSEFLLNAFSIPGVSFWNRHSALLVPTFGFIQAHLLAKNGLEAVTLQPEFGRTDTAGVVDGIARGGRPFALHFPGIDGVLRGDGRYFGKFLASIHDWLHAHYGSSLSERYREVLARVFSVAKEASLPMRMDDIVDLNVPSAYASRAMTVGEQLAYDFSRSGALGDLIRRDGERHPDFWSSRELAGLARSLP
ncbi:MAG TPA: hypothetical protein VNI01_16315 [Elusimicrobiota bacterium]|jgi:hypothetical protein|nr:hypothetical protein [Elusimicrobiota bacterium]